MKLSEQQLNQIVDNLLETIIDGVNISQKKLDAQKVQDVKDAEHSYNVTKKYDPELATKELIKLANTTDSSRAETIIGSHIHSIMAKAGAVMNPENLYKDSAKHKAVRKLDKLYNKIGKK